VNVLKGNSEGNQDYKSIDALEKYHFEWTDLVFIEYPFFCNKAHTIENNR